MPEKLYLGIDLGTSGARAVVIDVREKLVSSGKAAIAGNHRSPANWRRAMEGALDEALSAVCAQDIHALAVDGTSGTVLAVDKFGSPLADALMYNDPPSDINAEAKIGAVSGPQIIAGLPALLRAQSFLSLRPARILHQADWLAFLFSGRFVSDDNNALKTGYSSLTRSWPEWMAKLDVCNLLPEVTEPGTIVGMTTQEAANRFGLARETLVIAGTTDGCASFLAAGATEPGDAVSVLGTTLTLKLLSNRRIDAPEFGIYSHRLLGNWLAGGASNTGGAALLNHFSTDEIGALSAKIDPCRPTGLNYYPLPKKGERFPVNDPDFNPRLTPRPADPATFLHGLFEGIANIETQGYALLEKLGAPSLKTVRSMGGGAKNMQWTAIRARSLHVPLLDATSEEAAYGTARLARLGAQNV
ncbi:FGGY-family carbohydrate kinase [Ochrobactrum sp. BTU1]|uniref:FGGY-family carbohydrate kinase n=1 Tax=Ochrobactrum sp. BTU1 TaxID=2840456 RepID=UPI001C058CF3|nr:FGGY-family carbohydrate kinase [Ochrobactrum sp. BTU1]